MATFSMSTVAKGSDEFKDFCSICEEQSIEVVADFYCETCLYFYCGTCIHRHGCFFKNHSPYGRGEMKEWPVSKKVEDFLLKCEVHKDSKLEMFCNDHSQLCCANCAFLNHRQCAQKTLISESVKMKSTELQRLSTQIQTILEEMKSLQNDLESNIQSLQVSYDEHERYMFEEMLLNIKSMLDDFDYSTYGNEQYQKEGLCRKMNSILDEFDSTVNDSEMKDELMSLQASIKTGVDSCSRLQDELKQLHEAMQRIGDNEQLSFIASTKCLHKIQQALTVLGKSGQVLTVKGKSEYDVSIPSDSSKRTITAICVLPDGQIIVADNFNKKVKLLDLQYRVLTHCDVSTYIWDICHITLSEVAVTVNDYNTYEVQFISVNNGQLVKGRKLQLQHFCSGIAHHQGDLYVTSGRALYKYTLSGKLVSKLYEDTSDNYTVYRCAVSPIGDMIYITNLDQHKLLNLARDGSVLYTFTDPELQYPRAVHVTHAGQVLVCGGSHTVIQVDREGRKKLASLATLEDGARFPRSVCYNRQTASIIEGRSGSNNILVFNVQ